jgi:carbonic anhydrase
MPCRRHVLASLAALVSAYGLDRASSAFAQGAAWSYQGDTGPDAWGRLDPAYRVCSAGKEQSPIDLAGAVRAELALPQIEWQPMPLEITNNGHCVLINAAPGNITRLAGESYELLDFHFHHPSEHLIGGRRFDLECHFVHRSAAGRLAVLGVVFEPGAKNAGLQAVLDAAPKQAGRTLKLETLIDPRPLLPSRGGIFRYAGSTTEPPCQEGVSWVVYRTPAQATATQIKSCGDIFPPDARPLQPLGSRFVLEGG